MADVLPFQQKRTTTTTSGRANRAAEPDRGSDRGLGRGVDRGPERGVERAPRRGLDRGPEPLWREALGRSLRAVREEQGGRLVDIAARAGISPQYLSEIERGRKEPSSEMIAAVAGALGLELADLLAGIAITVRRHAVSGHEAIGRVDTRRAVTGHAITGHAITGGGVTGHEVSGRAVGRGRPAGPALLAA